MTQSSKTLAKRFASEGWCDAYLELRPNQSLAKVQALLAKISATDVEELTPAILSAKIPVDRIDELEKHAVVTPMERKAPKR